MRSTLRTLLLCLCFMAAPAQASDTQLWGAVAINGPVEKDSKLLLWFDGHARSRNEVRDLGVSIIRPALGWRMGGGLDLWLGYARVTGHVDGPNIKEDRIWQQATYPIAPAFGGNVSGRTRLEQRFRGAQGDDVGWRLRQFVRWGKRLQGTDFSLVVWDELFMNINTADWGQESGFGQNRLFVGGAYHMSKKTRFELGYLNNHINNPTGNDPTNNVISLTLFVGL